MISWNYSVYKSVVWYLTKSEGSLVDFPVITQDGVVMAGFIGTAPDRSLGKYNQYHLQFDGHTIKLWTPITIGCFLVTNNTDLDLDLGEFGLVGFESLAMGSDLGSFINAIFDLAVDSPIQKKYPGDVAVTTQDASNYKVRRSPAWDLPDTIETPYLILVQPLRDNNTTTK